MTPIAHLDALENKLAARGFPPMSPWWRETLIRFYASGRRQLVLRVGRRGGKSSSLIRIAVLEALYGEHVIPPGDVGVVAIVSVSRDEARARLRTVVAILDALGVGYRTRDEAVEVDDRPIVFKIFSATIQGGSGFTAIVVICDEAAKWRDADTGANPAKEVLAALRPTMATMPHAKLFLSSSPMSSEDAHFAAYELGENAFQCVAYAPTWVANPSISEAETHALEPDGRVWTREYLAEPVSALAQAFDPALIDRAMSWDEPLMAAGRPILSIDASSGRGDSFAHSVLFYARTEAPSPWLMKTYENGASELVLDSAGNPVPNPEASRRPPRRVLVVANVEAIEGKFSSVMTADEVVDQLVLKARRHGITSVHGDQRDEYALTSAFARRGLHFTSHAWTGGPSGSKALAVAELGKHLREKTLCLPTDAELRRELYGFSEKILPSGTISYGARSTGRDDRVATILTGLLADIDGALAMSPLRPASGVVSSGAGWGTFTSHRSQPYGRHTR